MQNKMKLPHSDNVFMNIYMKYIKKTLWLPFKEVSYIWTLITRPVCSINQMWHQVDSFLPTNQYKITDALFFTWAPPVLPRWPCCSLIHSHHPVLRMTWMPLLPISRGNVASVTMPATPIPNAMYLHRCFLKAETH